MVQSAPVRPKINTRPTQLARGRALRPPRARGQAARSVGAPARVSGDTRESVRRSDRLVVELECGVTVYPAREPGDVWRAVWSGGGSAALPGGGDRGEAGGEAGESDRAADRRRAEHGTPGDDLIAFYLSPDRLPADRQWSRKHAHTQARLCERFALPVIGRLACQDITVGDMQQIVNAAPTPGEGTRARGMISALVSAGTTGGYLASPRLKEVHWQAGNRPLPPPPVGVAGEIDGGPTGFAGPPSACPRGLTGAGRCGCGRTDCRGRTDA